MPIQQKITDIKFIDIVKTLEAVESHKRVIEEKMRKKTVLDFFQSHEMIKVEITES